MLSDGIEGGSTSRGLCDELVAQHPSFPRQNGDVTVESEHLLNAGQGQTSTGGQGQTSVSSCRDAGECDAMNGAGVTLASVNDITVTSVLPVHDVTVTSRKHTYRISFTEKMLRTVGVYASYFAVALNLGIIGPCLLDLEALTHSTTSEISTVFTCRGILAIAGSLVLGPILDKTNKFLIVGVALLVDFVLYLAVPWCRSLPAALVAMAPPEFFNCGVGMASHLICIGIWKEKSGPVLLMLNLVSVTGFMVAPLLVKPFLSSEHHSTLTSTNTTFQILINSNNDSSMNTYHIVYFDQNFLSPSTSSRIDETSIEEWTTSSAEEEMLKATNNTPYVFVLVAIYSLLIGIVMMALFLLDVHRERRLSDGEMSPESSLVRHDPPPPPEEQASTDALITTDRVFVIKVSLLFFVFNFFYSGIEIGYAGLVMTFAVKALHWSKSDGTNVTALVQGSNAVLTAVAVLLSPYVKPQIFVTVNVIVVNISLMLLCALVQVDSVWLWVLSAFLGAGYASIMPSCFAWVNSFMEVNGKFSSIYWAGFFTGFMAVPAATGYLFNEVDAMWFPYAMTICAVGMAIAYSQLCVMVNCRRPGFKVNCCVKVKDGGKSRNDGKQDGECIN